MSGGGVQSKEVEFEFSEEPGTGAAKFQVTSNVRGVILRHLAQGEIDAAATLIATSDPEVGDALFADLRDASVATKGALAEAFIKARDFERAGRAAMLTGDPRRAASFFERSYRFDEAAQLYEQAGDLEHAAELFSRGLRFDRAAALYERANNVEAAANAYEKAGDALSAGRLWTKIRRLDRAVEALQRVDATTHEYPLAVYLLGRVFEHTGHRDAAVVRYIDVVKTRAADESTVDVYERLAEIYIQVKEERPARKLLERVLSAMPGREKARALLASLPPAAPRVGTQTDQNPPKIEFRPSMPPPSLPGGPVGRESILPPLVLPGEPPPTSERVTTIHQDVDTLRKLPLFAELSLQELRDLREIGERAGYTQGTVLIEQDRQGEILCVILQGSVSVLHVDENGAQRELVQLGFGASIGEMALIDEGPTSARVRASTQVLVFQWSLEKLRRYLAQNEGTALRILKVMSRTLSVRLRETNRLVAGR